MIFELVVEPSAARDIADADAHYAQFDKADAFLSAIDVVFEQLTSMPLMYPAVHETSGAPYFVVFRSPSSSLWKALGSSCSQFTTSVVIRRRGPRLKNSVALPPRSGWLPAKQRVDRPANLFDAPVALQGTVGDAGLYLAAAAIAPGAKAP